MEQRERVYELLGINPSPEYWRGGVQGFESVPYQDIQEVATILGDSFLEEYQNGSPTVGDFLELLEEHVNETFFNGYVVSSDRNDERVTIDAVTTARTDGNIMAFRRADDFDLGEDQLFAWWD